MSGDDLLLGNQYACDLCPSLRRTFPRNMGADWVDGFWLCGKCFQIYCRKLVAAGRNMYVSGS